MKFSLSGLETLRGVFACKALKIMGLVPNAGLSRAIAELYSFNIGVAVYLNV